MLHVAPLTAFIAMVLMRVDGNQGSTPGYEPNSYGKWQEQPDFAEPPLKLRRCR